MAANLKNAFELHQAGNLSEARRQYKQILRHQPRNARAHFLLGLLLYQLGKSQSALEHARRAVSIDPAEPLYHGGLGLVQRGLKLLPQAIESYRQAIDLAPADPDYRYNLGVAAMQLEDLSQAEAAFKQAISLQPNPTARRLWQLELDGLCPAVMSTAGEIAAWRKRYATALEAHPAGCIDLAAALPLLTQSNNYPPFNLPYHGGNDLPLKARYAAIFTGETTRPKPRPEPPYRIGFVVTRTHERIFLSLMGGIVNGLTDPRLQPVIVAPHAAIPRLQAGITSRRVEWLPISEELPLAVAELRAARFDALYFWEVGSDSLNYFLPFFRPAAVQCTSWGLSSTTGIPQMDYFLSSDLLEPDNAAGHYSETLVRFKTLPTRFSRPDIPQPLKPRADFGLPDDAHIYFCPQNLLKIHPDFDPIVAEILRRDPAGRLVLLQSKTPRLTDNLQTRFRATLPDVLDRVTFIAPLPFADFMNLIALADVLLDTIHYSGGNTTHEALAAGTPIVTLPGNFLRGRLTLGRLRKIGVLDTVAATPQDYVDIAVRLGTDLAHRTAVKEKILAANHLLYDDDDAVREFEQFFVDAIQSAEDDRRPAPAETPSQGEGRGGGNSTSPLKPETVFFDGNNPPAEWPSVSLCMIVKNEADNLAECVASTGDLADEIIVVDTGSTDDTVAIAKSLGAKVFHFDWIDDFAAARNEALRHATGEWLFWLDADDRLSAEGVGQLKQAAASGRADVYTCAVVGPTAHNEDAAVAARHYRLLRNGLGVKFIYPLHEDLALRAANRPVQVAYTNITITHLGYDISPEAFRAKTRRNLAIIQKCLVAEPNNPRWLHHFGLAQSILGDYEAAVHAFESVISHPGGSLNEVEFYYAHFNLAEAYTHLNRPQAAEQIFRRARERFPRRRHLLVAGGIFYLDLDRPDEALRWLEAARQTPPESLADQGQSWRPGVLEDYLGLANLLCGRTDAAQAAYRAMPRSDGPEAWRQQADSAWQDEQWADAVRALARLAGQGLASADEWRRLVVAQLLKTGQTGGAKPLCRLALSAHPADAALAALAETVGQLSGGLWPALTALVDRMLGQPPQPSARTQLDGLAAALGVPAAELLRWHGMRQLSQKDHARAAETFALVIDVRPTAAWAYKSLAVALRGLGHEQEALAAWQVAAKLEG